MMKTMIRFSAILLLGVVVLRPAASDPLTFLEQQTDAPLSGGISRFHSQALDPQSQMLYIAHLGAGQIIVFNTKIGKITRTLSGFPGVTGLLVLPETHRLYACVPRRHQVHVINTESLKTLARIPAGNFPDSLAYVPDNRQLYVSDQVGGEVVVIDAVRNRRIESIKIGNVLGNVRYDPISRKVIVVGKEKNELVTIDPRIRRIIKRTPIHSGKNPHGLLIDEKSHLAFLACAGNEKLVVVDLNNYREIGVSNVGANPDTLDFDPILGYLYVASESGMVSVFRVRNRKIDKIGDYPVGKKAHSVAVNPKSHLVYFPLQGDKNPVLRIMKPGL